MDDRRVQLCLKACENFTTDQLARNHLQVAQCFALSIRVMQENDRLKMSLAKISERIEFRDYGELWAARYALSVINMSEDAK